MSQKRIKELSEKNEIRIHSIEEECFKTYGRVVEGFDFSEAIRYMRTETKIPSDGNIYIPSDPALEEILKAQEIENLLYGGMEIQAGYCNGRNSSYNGFEYHKCSEINVAVNDFLLVLGHVWDVKENTIYSSESEVFFVPEGTAIEMYQTTLHLSPIRINEEGFRDIVVLLKGTNTPLENKRTTRNEETALLLAKNKWVLSHKKREPLIKQGAFPGMLGENKELIY